jgi:3-phenylpropionate/trans-cinnamate dioxygenase ferredoxin reductase subunit
MHSTRYLIVGGGMTGDAAAKSIREHDADGSITLVGEDPQPPYKRPPLTKGLWSGGDEAKIWCGTADAGVELRLGRRVVAIDVDAQRATDDQGG